MKTELEKARELVEKLEREEKSKERETYIRKLEDVSDEEKIKFFDNMFNDALSMLKETEKNGCYEHETEYAWEAQMEILSQPGKDFWDYYNSLDE